MSQPTYEIRYTVPGHAGQVVMPMSGNDIAKRIGVLVETIVGSHDPVRVTIERLTTPEWTSVEVGEM